MSLIIRDNAIWKPDPTDSTALLSASYKDIIPEIEQLRTALKQALRQWAMYADMHEGNDGFDLETEKSPEADIYRAALALVR